MITKSEMVPLMLTVCPSFEGKWSAFLDYWRDETDLPVYLALSDLARHLIDMLARNDVSLFPEVFDVVERWHAEGDSYVTEAATVGLLEDLQNAGLHTSTEPEQFRPYLLPESAKRWDRLYEFWAEKPFGYRRSNQIKALDLRLELRKQRSDLDALVQDLPALLDRSRASRAEVLAAQGRATTGGFEAWKERWNIDRGAALVLTKAKPSSDETLEKASPEELEAKLVTLHELMTKANSLRDTYVAELAADDASRAQIRADAQFRIGERTQLGARVFRFQVPPERR